MDFKIVDVYISSGQLVVTAEHFKPDGTAWFTEHYTWQGREGLKQKRATNTLGQLLLDDGTVAPTIPGLFPIDLPRAFLPPGRTWALRPGPHMDDSSILTTIRSIHQQRLTRGWPTTIDRMPGFKFSPQDESGVLVLLAKFRLLFGHQE